MPRMVDLNPEDTLAWMERSFHVHPERGVLIWKAPPKNHPRMLGREAGSARPGGSGKEYVYVKKDRHALRRGWLIYLWVHHRWPENCLDHIDGNSSNDAIANIREATVTQNAWNHKRRARRINLPMGVRLIRDSGRYEARISHNKVAITIGAFDTPEAAHNAYLVKRKELYREFA